MMMPAPTRKKMDVLADSFNAPIMWVEGSAPGVAMKSW